MHTNTNHLFCFSLSAPAVEMSLSKLSPFQSSAPSMYTQSSPKPRTDSFPFYMDFGSNSESFGRFTVTQISRNGQLHTEPTFQVFRKDNSWTFEKYQQMRIEDYEFQKFCFLKEDLHNGELEMRENQLQFDKNIGMEHVLEQSEIDLHWTKPETLCYFPPIHQGQPSFNLCTNLTFLSKGEQRVQTSDLCQLHSG